MGFGVVFVLVLGLFSGVLMVSMVVLCVFLICFMIFVDPIGLFKGPS